MWNRCGTCLAVVTLQKRKLQKQRKLQKRTDIQSSQINLYIHRTCLRF